MTWIAIQLVKVSNNALDLKIKNYKEVQKLNSLSEHLNYNLLKDFHSVFYGFVFLDGGKNVYPIRALSKSSNKELESM